MNSDLRAETVPAGYVISGRPELENRPHYGLRERLSVHTYRTDLVVQFHPIHTSRSVVSVIHLGTWSAIVPRDGFLRQARPLEDRVGS